MNSKISIIMGVYNCSATIEASLDSIINQTYDNWELIVCDDGSSDDTFSIAQKYAFKYPNKIKVLKNDCNRGLTYTLNKCLDTAQGDYIARQDGDDISDSNRFKEQVNFLEQNNEYSIVSSAMYLFDENGVWGKTNPVEKPTRIDFIQGSPFAHAASMIRKDALLSVYGYRNIPRTLRVEDYDLWFRLYEVGYRGFNFVKPMYSARDDRDAISRRKYKYRINEAWVMLDGFRRLEIPLYKRVIFIKPLIVGLLPKRAYKFFRGLLRSN